MSSVSVHPVDFEPSLVGERLYATRRLPTRLDVAACLSLMILLAYLLPASQIVPGFTYAGRPAMLVAMLLWCWWLLARLNPWLIMTGPQPVRWAVLAFLLSFMLSYLSGILRGLTSLEANGQTYGMLETVEFLGVILAAADGIPNWERLKGVLHVFLWCSGVMAVIGLVQNTLAFDFTQFLVIPGLETRAFAGLGSRGEGLFRVSSTATHYIEFSTVMAMAVPFAIHFARFAPKRSHRRAFAFIGLLAAAVIPLAISRTGVVALAAALVVMVPAWKGRLRYNLMVVGFGLVGALMVLRPGVLGTLRVMFTGASEDPSVTGRTDDYAYVSAWFAQRPWLGRGPRTLIPELYLVLDNQWLYTLVTCGLVGVVALAALHITCITMASIALRRSTREEDRHLCAALISAQVVAIVVAATFDSLSFTTFTLTLGLLSGVCGAVWRFTHPARVVRTATVRRFFS